MVQLYFPRHLRYRSGTVSKTDAGAAATGTRPRPGLRSRSRTIVHVLLFLAAAVIVLDALAGDRGLLAMLRVRREYRELAATVARARAENARLGEQARRLREDPAAVEEVARRELGLIKPGEKVFIIKDAAPNKH
jgi:cell division protein FtsB